MKNEDGLIPGQTVDFDTMRKINLERKDNARREQTEGSGTGQVHADKPKVQNTPKPTRKKKA